MHTKIIVLIVGPYIYIYIQYVDSFFTQRKAALLL